MISFNEFCRSMALALEFALALTPLHVGYVDTATLKIGRGRKTINSSLVLIVLRQVFGDFVFSYYGGDEAFHLIFATRKV